MSGKVIEKRNDIKQRKEIRNKSLKFKIIVPVIIFTVSIVLIFGVMAGVICYNSTVKCLKDSMSSAVRTGEDNISCELESLNQIVSEISSNSILYESDTSKEEVKVFLDQKSKEYGFFKGYTINLNGISGQGNENFEKSEFFVASKAGEEFISTPEVDSNTDELYVTVSSPIWEGGKKGTSVIGVLAFNIPHSIINSSIENLQITENSVAYVIDKNGYDICDSDIQCIIDRENIEEEAKTDTTAQSLANYHAKARAGETGLVNHSYLGVKEYFAYTPIEGSDGWSLCVNAPQSDFTGGVKKAIYISIILMIIFIALATYIAKLLANRIVTPITSFVNRLSQLADGDVVSPLPETKSTSAELISLKQSLESTLVNTGAIIKDVDYVLSEIANGNLDVNSKIPDKYIGDYKNILTSLKYIKENLNRIFSRIMQVAGQVSDGSSQVSDAAQNLAQGTTEQASSIQELSASIAEVTEDVKKSAEKSETAKNLTNEASQIMQGGVEDMEHTRQAMQEISDTSQDISKVIKAIDDIAFQTNILALNAAVEAARAGTAGKGFAVVADEVRNLSQKSAEAAKNTTVLIGNSIAAVKNGANLVNKTNADFSVVAEKAAEVTQLIGEISDQAQHEAEAVNQISNGVEQVSSVVQMNSATSEESAAASEELSSQATALKNLVENVRLGDANKEDQNVSLSCKL